MFTIGDISNIAVQIERNGEEAYRKASKAAGDAHVAEILNWMADEEKRHAKWFSQLKSSKPLSPEQQELEKMGRTLLQDMIKGNNFLLDEDALQNAESVGEVIEKSKELESETILFYEFLTGFLEDQEAIQQLEVIIAEERNHIKQLELLDEPGRCHSCSCS